MSAPGPYAAARRTLSTGQRVGLAAVGVLLVAGVTLATTPTLIAVVAVLSAAYVAAFAERLLLLHRAIHDPGLIVVDPDDARACPDADLPLYTVLVPAYQEPEVLPHLLAAIGRLEYPADRLEVLLLLEEDDEATYAAARAAASPPYLRVVRVPYSEPRTKPKACNIGLEIARGDFVTIFDAEDRPEPLQLRRAVAAFRRLPPSVACLQAKLGFFNHKQNILTQWFTAEYAMWFEHMLPGLVRQDAPVPLGGTSNHFRTEVLRELGGWDPFNVTEDADLGVRLYRRGYRTLILDSVTLEEANSDAINWLKQRSRWYKGYLQTWLVHSRQPLRRCREMGLVTYLRFNLFVGGTPLLAIINPIFWALTLMWFVGRVGFVHALFPAWLLYASLVCLVAGNFTFVYVNVLAARATGLPGLVFRSVLSLAYWVLMSLAAAKAMVQLVLAPSFWEKTTHGLGATPLPPPSDPLPDDVVPAAVAAAVEGPTIDRPVAAIPSAAGTSIALETGSVHA
ncbi:glycosyltransferase [Frankia sp. ACN1ag]|uniref:glycosyltransferase n=1 Tax=Frankia sp. ACN1ag TaxID=102891 RepID=UPI0006DC83B6|nr:glycosyltransferase [Frankia sp. ACN1ag]